MKILTRIVFNISKMFYYCTSMTSNDNIDLSVGYYNSVPDKAIAKLRCD